METVRVQEAIHDAVLRNNKALTKRGWHDRKDDPFAGQEPGLSAQWGRQYRAIPSTQRPNHPSGPASRSCPPPRTAANVPGTAALASTRTPQQAQPRTTTATGWLSACVVLPYLPSGYRHNQTGATADEQHPVARRYLRLACLTRPQVQLVPQLGHSPTTTTRGRTMTAPQLGQVERSTEASKARKVATSAGVRRVAFGAGPAWSRCRATVWRSTPNSRASSLTEKPAACFSAILRRCGVDNLAFIADPAAIIETACDQDSKTSPPLRHCCTWSAPADGQQCANNAPLARPATRPAQPGLLTWWMPLTVFR